MSSPKLRFELSPLAQQDFIGILRHTGKEWGQDQLIVYRNKLTESFDVIGGGMLSANIPRLATKPTSCLKRIGYISLARTSSFTELSARSFRSSAFCTSE
jgi:plasmid stabilization system protein ParE